MLRKGAPSTATCPHEARQATGAGVMTAKLALEELHSMPRVHCSRVQSMMNASQFYSLQQKAAQNFFWGGFRPGEAGKALLPHSTPESSQNWESEQSSGHVTQVGQAKSETINAAGTATPVGIPILLTPAKSRPGARQALIDPFICLIPHNNRCCVKLLICCGRWSCITLCPSPRRDSHFGLWP